MAPQAVEKIESGDGNGAPIEMESRRERAASGRRTVTRGLMIAAPRSGSGKTTLTLGLLRAFRRRGVAVVGLKSGPDYIDPAFHAAASGADGVNLNSWAMAPELLSALAAGASGGYALALCEASMGLFDGVPAPPGRGGASADVAAALGLPVLVVVDVSGQAQSAAAVVKGCATYDDRLRIAGVVVNRIGSERHRRLVTEAVEALGIPVAGALPRDDKVALPERHLGLVQAGETAALEARLEEIADFVEAHVDCERVLELAGDLGFAAPAPRPVALRPPGQKIALASRRSLFLHLSASRSRLARRRGRDRRLFADRRRAAPQRLRRVLAAGRLSRIARRPARRRARASSRACAASPRRSLFTASAAATWRSGRASSTPRAPRTRWRDCSASRRASPGGGMTLGYREARLAADCALGAAGAGLRGHEFHYATIAAEGGDEPFAFVTDAYGAPPRPAGSRRGFVTGSFFHVIAGT